MNLFSDEVRRNPYVVYEQLRNSSPVVQEPQSGLWMLFDYESVKRALSDHEAFSSRSRPEWLIFTDPPRHTKLRALISKAFTPRVVANLEPRIRELSRGLLDQTVERGEMDLADDYSVPLPMMVIAGMLGIPFEQMPLYRRWSDAILNLSHTLPGREDAAGAKLEFQAITGEMNAYLTEVLAERRAAPRDDLLTKLLEADVDGERLSQEEILRFFQLLLVGGQETTTNLINNAILCLIENPAELARLKASPELLPSAIEEVLRYRSPLQWMFRTTTRDVEMQGQTIPAGRLVLLFMGSANRDPKQFRDPDRFDISRDPNSHVAFGHGIHFCLGAALSRLEARIALPDLLERLKNIEVASTKPWEPRSALHVHGPTHLPIRFTPGRRARSTELVA